MRKLIVLAIFLLVAGAADLTAKSWAESQIEERAKREAGEQAGASASISSFPFLGRLLVTGSAGDIDLRMSKVKATGEVQFSTVDIELDAVKLDRDKLFSRDVELRSVDEATITVGFSAADLSERLGRRVTIDDGKVGVDVAGRVVLADVSATAEGSIRLSVQGLPAFSLPIPRTSLVNCMVARVQVDEGELLASCTVKEIPPALVQAAARVG